MSTEPGPGASPDPSAGAGDPTDGDPSDGVPSDGDGDGGKPPAGRRDLDDIDAVFGALAHATRRHVLQVLAARHGEMTAGELSGRFSHSWPTTTRHLAVLVDAGLVAVERVGRERRYRLQRQRLGDVLALWLGSVGYALHDDGDLERGST